MSRRKRNQPHPPTYVMSVEELTRLKAQMLNQAVPLGDSALMVWAWAFRRRTMTNEDLASLDKFKVPAIPEQQFALTVGWIIERVAQQPPNHTQEQRDKVALPLVFMWMQSLPPTYMHSSPVPTI